MSNDMHQIRTTEDNVARLAQRDAETQLALGTFITILSLPVLVGSFWAEAAHARIVNIVAGAVLLAVGIGLFSYGWMRRRQIHRKTSQS